MPVKSGRRAEGPPVLMALMAAGVFLSDLVRAVIDPRIRLEGGTRR